MYKKVHIKLFYLNLISIFSVYQSPNSIMKLPCIQLLRKELQSFWITFILHPHMQCTNNHSCFYLQNTTLTTSHYIYFSPQFNTSMNFHFSNKKKHTANWSPLFPNHITIHSAHTRIGSMVFQIKS